MPLVFPKLLLPGLIPCDNYYIMPRIHWGVGAPVFELNYIPIWISTYCKIIEIGFVVSTLSATNRAKVGIYEYDIETGNPTNLIKAGDSEILFSATGYKFTTIDVSLDSGVYYIGYVVKDITGSIIRGLDAVDPILINKNPTDLQKNLGKVSSTVPIYVNEMSLIAPGPFNEFTIGLIKPNPILKVRSI